MKNNFKFSSYLLIFFFISLVLNASEKEKICPFELISFNVETIRDSVNNKLIVNLEWQTASEMNTDKFIVERYDWEVISLIQDYEFLPIAEIQTAGTSSSVRTYNYKDTLILDLQPVTYRLKGVDKDSSFVYSSEIYIDNYVSVNEKRILTPDSIIENIYPNPSQGILSISLRPNVLGYFNTSIFDDNGIILNSIRLDSSKELINMDLSELSSGEYYINVSRGTNFELRKIVIIK